MRKHLISFPRIAAPALALTALLAAGAAPAHAKCPVDGSPSRAVCKPSSAVLLPSAMGMVYVPGDGAMGPWYGGGLQLVLFTWSDNSDRFGPGQGKVFFDLGLLGSSDERAGKMMMFRGGANVSFERNASRSWLIPFFGFSFGALRESSIATQTFGEGLLGVHALYMPSLIVDIEGGYLIPFGNVDLLSGFRTQLTVSFALW